MQQFYTGTAYLKRYSTIAKSTFLGLFSPEMSARMFFLDFVLFPPVIMLCLYLAVDLADPKQWLTAAALVGSGYVAWTLAEYLIHRFAFHHFPVFRALHMAHHDEPRDLIGTPTIVTLAAFYGLVFWPLAELTSRQTAAAWTAGLMAGYVSYIAVHYVVHHLGSHGSLRLRKLIRLHAVHHHDIAHNFGVTTGFWDRVFGTLAKR